MKKNLTILLAVMIGLGWSCQVYAFEGETHKALTEKAVSNNNQSVLDNYLKDELSMGQGLNSVLMLDESNTPDSQRVLPKIPQNPTVLDLLKTGADLEDIPLPRARHHFHDSYRNTGLDNKADHPDWWGLPTLGPFDLTGESALHWATVGTAEKEPTTNDHYWGKAREEFYKALTEESSVTREHYLALTFLTLGHRERKVSLVGDD